MTLQLANLLSRHSRVYASAVSRHTRSDSVKHFPSRLRTFLAVQALRTCADPFLVDVSNVTDVRLKTGCAIHSRSPNLVSKLSFSLMSGGELSLLDLDAIHAAQLAEWTDGIRVLRGDGGMMSGESANYVHVSD